MPPPFRQSIHWLVQTYGPLLDAAATAKAMGFRSPDALRQARRDGRLPIPMFKIEGRRGWFSSTPVVAEWLDAQGSVPDRAKKGGSVMPT